MGYPFQNYQPYPYQDQLSQLRGAPMQMSYQMPQYGRQEPSALNWVQGEAGAKSWIVTPGSTVLLMDSESQRFYLKSADATGVPAMRTFEYTEVGLQKPPEAKEVPGYVTLEEFDGFKNDVLTKLEELSAPVEVQLSRKKKGDANE